MTHPRDDHDLPTRPLLPFRQAALMIAVVALALGGWLLLPSSPITVALLAIVLLATVFVGVGTMLRARGLDEKPGRNPVPPPSMDT